MSTEDFFAGTILCLMIATGAYMIVAAWIERRERRQQKREREARVVDGVIRLDFQQREDQETKR